MNHKPLSPADLVGTCQHVRIDNDSFRCVACNELMVSVRLESRTVQSAPNLNPCTNPEHLAAIRAGQPVDCDQPYVPGPARTVHIGADPTYECGRCQYDVHSLIQGEPFVPDCGHSHRGDTIRPGAEQ